FIRRAHDEPIWGRFITRFAFNTRLLQDMFRGPPGADLELGIASGRYSIEPAMADTVVSMVGGCAVSGMLLVLEGRKTWRDVGSEAAELMLRALGIPSQEARHIACLDLPDLPPLP
ncbi:MAG: TetR family transcriptional regulator, partial [Pseudomonadales bacterium 32-61-5]